MLQDKTHVFTFYRDNDVVTKDAEKHLQGCTSHCSQQREGLEGGRQVSLFLATTRTEPAATSTHTVLKHLFSWSSTFRKTIYQ